MNHISILYNSKRIIIPVKDIIRIEASNNYSRIHCNYSQPLVVAKVLQWFELNLPNDTFFRIHQTHLINCNFIKEVQRNNILELTTGETVQGSRRKQPIFKMMVQKMMPE